MQDLDSEKPRISRASAGLVRRSLSLSSSLAGPPLGGPRPASEPSGLSTHNYSSPPPALLFLLLVLLPSPSPSPSPFPSPSPSSSTAHTVSLSLSLALLLSCYCICFLSLALSQSPSELQPSPRPKNTGLAGSFLNPPPPSISYDKRSADSVRHQGNPNLGFDVSKLGCRSHNNNATSRVKSAQSHHL